MKVVAQLSRVSKLFDSNRPQPITALRDISFQVQPGEWLGVVGPNGSGKSTLLKLIAGIYRPSSGTVTVAGHCTPLLGWGAGFLPQLNVRDNIFLSGLALGISRSQLRARYADILALAEAEQLTKRRVSHLSSGMRLKLAFAVAMQTRSDLYLFDEVFAVGDAAFQHKAQVALQAMKERGAAVLLVSHNLTRIERWCNRALYLKEGGVQALGAPTETIEQYQRELPPANGN